ncbi:STAS domain-containing protein [Alteromonas aestuariivivens]|uniref:STAS domain-containing protein n=1 Tax=Alteromonas aestuariivivens TaxID=1938339 RepID=A0A3D8MC95_9ALTE|nr:STAS domain-containing protein [Alteromonas aestuariivivens]RDV28116.1 STAS domain-containing protein [Alteromonas aestuariivivens]
MNTPFNFIDDNGIQLQGELDRDSLTTNWWTMLDTGQKNRLTASKACRFDLSSVERIDSAGLAWLVNAVRDARANGIKITLQNAPEKLLKLAKISDVDRLLPLE